MPSVSHILAAHRDLLMRHSQRARSVAALSHSRVRLAHARLILTVSTTFFPLRYRCSGRAAGLPAAPHAVARRRIRALEARDLVLDHDPPPGRPAWPQP